MFRKTAFAAAVALALVAPATLAAQTCQGLASFASGRVQLGANLGFADEATIYGAGINFGSASGGFAGAQIGMADYDETDESSTLFGVSGGWQIPLGAAPAGLQLCPVASFVYLSGPSDVDDGVGGTFDLSGNELALGLSLGTAITSSPALSVVPFGAVSFRRAHTEFESTSIGDFESDDNYGLIDLGVGFVANEWITIRPSVSIPFAEPDDFEAETSYGVIFAFSFGRPVAR